MLESIHTCCEIIYHTLDNNAEPEDQLSHTSVRYRPQGCDRTTHIQHMSYQRQLECYKSRADYNSVVSIHRNKEAFLTIMQESFAMCINTHRDLKTNGQFQEMIGMHCIILLSPFDIFVTVFFKDQIRLNLVWDSIHVIVNSSFASFHDVNILQFWPFSLDITAYCKFQLIPIFLS